MVRRGVRRDKDEKEQNQERFMRSGEESGGIRKERNRIKGGHCGQERSQEGQGRKGTGSREATVVRRGVRRDKERKEQDQGRPVRSGVESGGTRKERNRIKGGPCDQEWSQEGQGRKGTGSGEATVVKRGVRRDKKRKEQDQERPLWSGVESGGTRKECTRIIRGHFGQGRRSQEGPGKEWTKIRRGRPRPGEAVLRVD